MPAPIQFGRYLLLERLAVGGMAEIFLAKSVGPSGFERLCVVKRALPHLSEDPEFVRMFTDEARVAAKLHHPGIVQIHDLGWSDGHYIAMEYLAGEDLASVLLRSRKEGLPVPLEVATRVIAAAAEALHFAHTFADPATGPLRIVHRDVSPSNLFVTFHGAVKVIDFGVARAEGRLASTLAGVTKGKLSYMSPEQARGLEVDARTDVWALGLCLRELITGRRLFAGDAAPIDRARQILHAPIPPPGEERSGVPPELDRITLRALQRDPAQRYPSAATLAGDLQALLSASPPCFGSLTPAGYLEQLFGDDYIRAKATRDRTLERSAPHTLSLHTARLASPDPAGSVSPASTTHPLPAPAPDREALLENGGATQLQRPGGSPGFPADAGEPTQPRLDVTGADTQQPAAGRSAPPASRSGWQRALSMGGLAALVALVVAGALAWQRHQGAGDLAASGGSPGNEALAVAAATVREEDPRDASPAHPIGSATPSTLPPAVETASPSTTRAASPAAHRPSKRSAAAQGTLTVRANVPVEAFLGARSLGPVPIEAVRVPPGRHSLRLVNSEKGLTHQSTVRVVSGRPTVHEVALGTGTLNVDAVPWAEVWIDGQKLGLTPIAGHVLWEGPHQVRLVGPEVTRQRHVRIRPGRVTALREDLRAPTAAR